MKKVMMMFVSLILCVSVCSCGSDKPEDVVISFCGAMKEFDNKKMVTYMVGDKFPTESGIGTNEMAEILKEYSTQMEYKVEETTVEEDKAVVTVRFDYPDLSPVVPEILAGYYNEALVMMFGGASEEEVLQLMARHFEEGLAEYDPVIISDIVDFECCKENEEWKIEKMPDKVEDIMSSNINAGYQYYNSGY